MDRLRIDPPDPALWKRFWFNVTGHTRKGDPGNNIICKHAMPYNHTKLSVNNCTACLKLWSFHLGTGI